MKLTVPTNYNYHLERPIKHADIGDGGWVNKVNDIQGIHVTTQDKKSNKFQGLFEPGFEITTRHESLTSLKIFRFKPVKDDLEKEERLILKLFRCENPNEDHQYFVQTGLFAGVVYHKGCEFNITCDYGEVFLNRMLNFLNNIYIDTAQTAAEKKNKANTFQHILCYLFIHALERASTLGLPKAYQQKRQHDYKMRGALDMKAHIKQDIPFMGKISSQYRELNEIQPIVDVLYLACEKLKKAFGVDALKPVMNIYQQLKIQYSGKYFTQLTLQNAKNHKVLNNPMFAHFRQTLEYAEIILKDLDLKSQKEAKHETYGYLFDISQLFEIYLEKLLAQGLNDWKVYSQEKIKLYQERFYGRNIYPDIVLKNNEKVIVLDAKFKKMTMNSQDLDRSDFYQIHTYMQYYGENLLFGGLIYPLSVCHEGVGHPKSYSKSLFDLEERMGLSRFIVDGIELRSSNSSDSAENELGRKDKLKDITEREKAFIERINKLIQEFDKDQPVVV